MLLFIKRISSEVHIKTSQTFLVVITNKKKNYVKRTGCLLTACGGNGGLGESQRFSCLISTELRAAAVDEPSAVGDDASLVLLFVSLQLEMYTLIFRISPNFVYKASKE